MYGTVAVIGAGPVGCLVSLALAKRGYTVTVFEYRSDPRTSKNNDHLRSINLAISARGIAGLESVDKEVAQCVLKDIIPMKGRMIHDTKGQETSQLYGLHKEAINSIDRSVLNISLLNAQDSKGIATHFDQKLTKIEFNDTYQRCYFAQHDSTSFYDFDFVIGCDGVYSTVRRQMQKIIRMDFNQTYIDRCYIELYIPPQDKQNAKFVITPDHLHIWPRDQCMLIALPNTDGSFTSTFFGPWEQVEDLVKCKEKLRQFLLCNFPDAMKYMGLQEAIQRFLNNPKGELLSLQCNKYHVPGGKCIILGDAAHAMVPFYGQGMNCGFEDVRILMELLDEYDGDRALAFEHFTSRRVKDHAAIIELSKRNFYEMSHDVTSKIYLFKKRLNNMLNRILQDRWLPLYTMVSFRQDIAYHKAFDIAKYQNRIVNIILSVFAAISSYGSYRIVSKILQRYMKRINI